MINDLVQALRVRVLRRLARALQPGAGRQALYSHVLFTRFNASPEFVTEVPGGRVLVLAPHMDDEVFGCGGVLAKHVQAGAETTVVYMTDGRRGDPRLYGRLLDEKELRNAEEGVVAQRKREAEQASKLLGVQNLIFLDLPDGDLRPSPEAVEKLRTVLERAKPERVYLPSLLDNHADHWQTNCVFYEAMKNGLNGTANFSCWGYEIWPPLYANRLVDIGDVMETKKLAIDQFQSQLCHMDYARCFISLNSYRSMFCQRGAGYAEAFFSSPLEEYLVLFERMSEAMGLPIPQPSHRSGSRIGEGERAVTEAPNT